MESLTLGVALSPQQFEDLNGGRDVHPDEYSGRFGLRTAPAAAVDRAQYFMDWTDGLKGEHHQKDYTVLQVEISALGYLQKMETGILEKVKYGEYRWYGSFPQEQQDGQGGVLCPFSETAARFT